MIQRIQTVYLLIVAGLLITAMCMPIGYFIDTMGEHPFKALGLEINDAFQSTWGLFGILMLSTIVAVATIFLYKNRMLQIRMTIFNSLLLVGYYIAALAFYFALKNDANMFRVGWALCLPLISIILNILAVRAIGRDEVMVKAADEGAQRIRTFRDLQVQKAGIGGKAAVGICLVQFDCEKAHIAPQALFAYPFPGPLEVGLLAVGQGFE